MNNKNMRNVMIGVIVVALAVVIGLLVFNNKPSNEKMMKTSEVTRMVNDKKTFVLFVENTEKDKCTYCDTVKKHLNTNKIDYSTYDTSKNSKEDYEVLLKNLNIDKSLFNYPAVIYVKDGMMYANIINISDTKVIDQFIKDYELNK